jgi:hypothetical protein
MFNKNIQGFYIFWSSCYLQKFLLTSFLLNDAKNIVV